MPRLLLLLSRQSYRAEAFLAAAAKLGVDVIVGSDHAPALGALAPGHALELPLADPEAGARKIAQLARTHPLDAVIAAEDDGALLAARAAAALGLRANTPDSVANAGLKHLLRRRLAETGVEGPAFRVASVEDVPGRIAREIPYPAVVKPVFLAASRGVIRADGPGDFVAAFTRVARLLGDPELARRGGDAARLILIEEYVAGAEVALEGLLTNGGLQLLALFDKPDPMEGPFFEETIYVTPSRLPREAQDSIHAMTAQAATALGLTTGPVHAELRWTGAGPVLLEIAPRSIGGQCSRVLRFGPERISLEEVILRHALGMDVAHLEREATAAGVMMLPIPRAGVLREVRGLSEARRVPGVEDVVIAIPLGQEVVPLPEGHRYLGFIFARADGPKSVEDALRTAHRRLDFEVEPT